jgi:hypothetical protein
VHAGYIKTSLTALHVKTNIDKMGGIACHLEGRTNLERSIFINSLMEIVGPVVNPRYMIVRRSKLLGVVKQEDNHAVPEVLSRNKTVARYLANEWQMRDGTCDVIFTLSIEGRRLLLKCRLKPLSAQFEEYVEQQSRWLD